MKKRALRSSTSTVNPPAKKGIQPGGISSEAVAKATGKTWDEWLVQLDKTGCHRLDHKGIVAVIGKHLQSSWWQQMITVGYEQARGLRDRHEVPGKGYHASTSRIVGAPISKVFVAWHDDSVRRRWLGPATMTIRRATKDRSLRIAFGADATSLDVNLFVKDANRCLVQIEEHKLASEAAVQRSKRFWSKAFVKLKNQIEVVPKNDA